ncbi:hypothetical protein MAMC_01272 [Methylacidimicrobium cyclopophantes]|uniref:Uncharacterized protein n=1 Tax=Methylacidimicrobium cyclopophantes TaxID=1041766 RepID=A0A5E6MN11_9BACT|nr:hypothetical protein [Methylacidimicrobium cyclopophantes]VVM06814.1 hypothetical protein MAMC_01272 [Methylacidimicrobium cyclopophantes]
MKTRILRGLLFGCLLGCAATIVTGRLFGLPAQDIQRLQSADDPEPGQEPEERPGQQPGETQRGKVEPGEPKGPSEEPFTPEPYFPEIPQFQPDEPFVP